MGTHQEDSREPSRFTGHYPYAGASARRRVMLLAIMIGIMFAVGIWIILDWFVLRSPRRSPFSDPDLYLSVGALAALAVPFILNYLGRYRAAAYLFIMILTAAIFLVSIPSSDLDEVYVLYYLILPVLASGLLLSARFTAAVTGLILFGILAPVEVRDDIPLYYMTALSLSIVFATGQREYLEKCDKRALEESEKRFRTLVDNAPEAVLLLDASVWTVLEANPVAERLFEVPCETMRGCAFDRLPCFEGPVRRGAVEIMKERIRRAMTDELPAFEWHFFSRDNDRVYCKVHLVRFPSAGTELVRASFTDVTAGKRASSHIRYLVTHDPLTGLPNRAAFERFMNRVLLRARKDGSRFAVMAMDMDNFKTVNSALGNDGGDAILKIVSGRLVRCLPEGSFVTRRGGDEFAILLDRIRDREEIARIADGILKAIAEPCCLTNGEEVFVTSSIGVSLYPEDGTIPERLFRNADNALYYTKRTGKNRCTIFSGEMNRLTTEALFIGTELRYALERNELFAVYQPQIEVATGRTTGFEALLRWRHHERGLIPPEVFIPIAEETGLIAPLSERMMRMACEQAQKWRNAGLCDVPISVNISDRQIRRGDLCEVVKRVLEATGLPPANLELEMTETILFGSIPDSAALFGRLKELGVKISMDDFGSGYFTLRQLARFPLNHIKLDRSFARDIAVNRNDEAVVAGIISIAKRLGIEVIAEGVETTEQLEAYHDLGCGTIQGWYYSRALTPEECELWLANEREFLLRSPAD